MSIIITCILNFVKNKLFEFMKSKYFLVFVILVIISSIILFTYFQFKSKNKKIEYLENQLYTTKIELSNMVVQKNISFISNQNYIKEIYTNSSLVIENLIDDKKYNSNEIDVLNQIIRDYNTALARSPPR